MPTVKNLERAKSILIRTMLIYCDLTYWCYMNPIDQLPGAGNNVAIILSRLIT